MNQTLLSPAELTARTGLRPTDLAYIRDVLTRAPGVEQAWIYGSRARGTHRPGSDVDLALSGSLTGAPLDQALRGIRFQLLEEGPLPYLFDVTWLPDLADDHPLRAQIAADGVLVFLRNQA